MTDHMFRGVANPSIRVGAKRWYTVPLSIMIHLAAISAISVVPLMAGDALPTPVSMLTFVPAPPPPPPPPGPDIDVPTPVEEGDSSLPPIVPPDKIVTEPPFDLSDLNGVESTTAGKTVVGGTYLRLATPTPPVPKNPVRVGGNVSSPTKVADVPPVYPPVAQAARVQGVVILEAIIGTTGRVTEVRVLRSVPLLDDAALDAVRQWRYTPPLLNGTPVAVIVTVTVNFTLK